MSGGSFSANAGTVSIPSNTFSLNGGTFDAGSATIYIGNNMTIPSPSSFLQGTSTVVFNGNGSQDVVIISGNAAGTMTFYNLVIDKPNNGIIRFTSNVTDTFQVNNLVTLTAGELDGSGFLKVEKDLLAQPTFGGTGIPVACTGPNPGTIRLNAPLAVSGVSNFVGIAKSDPSVVVNVMRESGAVDDTIRIGNFDALFYLRRGILQFPQNPPIISSFRTIQIEPGGTLKCTSNVFYNAGQHINSGGTFLHNNGTYIFNYSPIPAYTQFATHNENFYNLIIDIDNGEFSPSASDTLIINGDLTLRKGTITGNDLSVLNAKGNVSFEANMKATQTHTQLMFSGTSDQQFTMANGTYDFWNAALTVDKASGELVLGSPVILDDFNNQSFTFKNGIVRSSPTNYLRFTNNVKAIGASNTSYVDGPVQYGWYSAFEFPIGNGGYYAPIRITGGPNSSQGTADIFAAQYFHTDPTPLYNTSSFGGGLTNVSKCEYWIVNRVTGTSPAYVWLSYDNQRSCGVGDASALRVSRWDVDQWSNGGNGLTENQQIRSVVTYNTYQAFTLASVNAAVDPLPVTFLKFTVTNRQENALLQWSTDHEINNNHFEIERSGNGSSFTQIGKVFASADNSSAIKNYSYLDQNTSAAKQYYRLKQVDNDGGFIYSPVVIFNPNDKASKWDVFYNHIGNAGYLFHQLPPGAQAEMVIRNSQGQVVSKNKFIADESGRTQFSVNAPAGIYYISVQSSVSRWTGQFRIM